MILKIEDEEESIKRIIDNTATALIYVSEAYVNFVAYSFVEYADDYTHDIGRNPLKFQKVCFQHFLTIQFCKLFENYKTPLVADAIAGVEMYREYVRGEMEELKRKTDP